MNYRDLLEKYYQIIGLIGEGRLAEAIENLGFLVDKCRIIDYRNRLNIALSTYQNMLRYSFELGDDPEKQKVYERLVKSLLELTDEVKEELIRQYSLLSYYNLNKASGGQDKRSMDDIHEWLNRQELGAETETQERDGIMKDFFTRIWLIDKLTEKEIEIITKSGSGELLSWYHKSLVVSALTLSTLRHFDVNKIQLLFRFYQDREHQVWQRALTGMLISLYVYDSRVKYYPELDDLLGVLHDDSNLNKVLENIVLQFLRARDTEELAEKIRNEFLPEIWKMRSTLES
jgi:hypothetical protein